eukprot:2469433-Rhodomonas_salina.4
MTKPGRQNQRQLALRAIMSLLHSEKAGLDSAKHRRENAWCRPPVGAPCRGRRNTSACSEKISSVSGLGVERAVRNVMRSSWSTERSVVRSTVVSQGSVSTVCGISYLHVCISVHQTRGTDAPGAKLNSCSACEEGASARNSRDGVEAQRLHGPWKLRNALSSLFI